MTAPSGDDMERASTTASAIRSLTVTGNRINSRDLFSNEREIIIAHGDDAYRLRRLTSQNKLILTK
jgi:hemin uptake protein HemP